MTQDEALDLLPPAYARALQLQSQGRNEQWIARELGVEAAAVGPLLRLAEAKLTRLVSTTRGAESATTDHAGG
jgi:hypothetical protein